MSFSFIKHHLPSIVFLSLVLAACSPAPEPVIQYDPASLRFSGEVAIETQGEFVMQFPYRHSGMPNNKLAAEWIRDRLTGLGLECSIDEWEVINYSKPVLLRNAVCKLPGASPREIVIAAHHDQSPDTIYGADNDGSGITILLQLAEIFASEGTPAYTLVFVSTDAEEYGMLGTKRYVDTHPDTSRIIAGVSLDNVGKKWSDGMDMSPIGQFRGYGPIWLLLTAREAARAAGDLWVPRTRAPLDQVLNQAVPVSFMDQGPMVAAGIPALGYATLYAPGTGDEFWTTYHSPTDLMEHQSPDVLRQSGRICESLVRQLLAMEDFPQESGPYLYLDEERKVLRGAPLWAIFIGIVACFFAGAFLIGGRVSSAKFTAWRGVLPHFLGLWAPLLGSIVLLYVFVTVGLMDEYHLYPATPKDEPIFEPRWPAVIFFLLGLTCFLFVGRLLARRYGGRSEAPVAGARKSLALLVVALAGVYIIAINPFSLLFFLPLFFWFFIGERRGAAWAFDLAFFALGGLVVYALFYFFGFVILRNNFTVLWYMMMMFSIGQVAFPTAAAITAVIAAGLSAIVTPPGVPQH